MLKNGVASATSRDAMQTVANAWDIAIQAAKDGAETARENAGNAIPAAGRFLSRLVYTMSYSLSYGTVFPVAFVAKSVPANNALVNGLVDGTRAATDWVDELKHRAPEPATPRRKPGRPRSTAKTTRKKSGR